VQDLGEFLELEVILEKGENPEAGYISEGMILDIGYADGVLPSSKHKVAHTNATNSLELNLHYE
jgi:adenylate cyclase class IV